MKCNYQSFYTAIVELNALDQYRDIKFDPILDDIVIRFDESAEENILKIFNLIFLPNIILHLFKNTHKLIDIIESDKIHKNHILSLKDKTKQHLTPLINGLEKDLLLAQAKGDEEEVIKIQISKSIHNLFLTDKQKALTLFEDAKIFLLNNQRKRNIAKRLIPNTQKQLLAKEKIQLYERVNVMQKHYRYYHLITENYQHKLWYSTAIKIYKLCKYVNQGAIDDGTLKEKIENLFFQINMKISLNTTRINEAKCHSIEEGVSIWRDGDSQKSVSKLLPFYDDKLKEQFKLLKNTPYAKILENPDNTLFCLI